MAIEERAAPRGNGAEMNTPITPIGWTDPFQLVAGLWNRRGLLTTGEPLVLVQGGQATKNGVGWAAMMKHLELAEVMASRKIFDAALQTILPRTLTQWSQIEGAEDRRWFEMALVTNPGSTVCVGTHSWSPGPGAIVEIDRRMPHCAINMGDTIRVHLLFEVKGTTDA